MKKSNFANGSYADCLLKLFIVLDYDDMLNTRPTIPTWFDLISIILHTNKNTHDDPVASKYIVKL